MASVHKSAAPSAPSIYDLAAQPSYGQEQPPPVYSQATPPPSYGQELPPPVYCQAMPPPSYGQAQPPPMTGVPAQVQPSPPAAQALGVPGQWSSGLCDCCSDVTNCCITCWCPCITFGQIAEIVDKGSTACGVSGALYALIAYTTGCACIYSCFYRSKMRRQYMLAEEPCGDCLVHCCCESCALCQEYRELRHCGFDMSLGWAGNMDKQNYQGEIMPPLVQGGMYR